MLFFNLGNTAGFCSSKPNGTYKNPDNPSQFFSCISGQATACQLCNDGLVYVEECQRCKYASKILITITVFKYKLFNRISRGRRIPWKGQFVDKNLLELSVYRTFPQNEIWWKGLHFTWCILRSAFFTFTSHVKHVEHLLSSTTTTKCDIFWNICNSYPLKIGRSWTSISILDDIHCWIFHIR